MASPQEQVDVKQVILGASHWFLLRGAAWGVLQEPGVAITGSVPVAVTGSRYGHLVPVTANTQQGRQFRRLPISCNHAYDSDWRNRACQTTLNTQLFKCWCVGALIIGLGLWGDCGQMSGGMLYQNYNKDPPPPKKSR